MAYDAANRMITFNGEEVIYDCENIRISKETSYYTEEYVTDTVYTMSQVMIVERTYKTEEGAEETQLNTETTRY